MSNEEKITWANLAVRVKDEVSVVRYSDLNTYVAHQFDDHPTGAEVNVTEFIREEAMQAQPIVLSALDKDGGRFDRIGYFVTHTEVRIDAEGKQFVGKPTTRSTYDDAVKWVRDLRAQSDATNNDEEN